MSTATIVDLEMEVRIAAPVDKVWQALTDDIGAWWPNEFYTGGDSETRTYTLEARPGGRMFEQWKNGGGTLWGTVVSLDPGKMLQVLGSSFPNWGGPTFGFGTWTLESAGDDTVLRFSESTMGRVSDQTKESKAKGWDFLFEKAMKSHLEGRPIPAWED
ncbi:MAG: SRPBCC domain-containing protein [Acidobacteriota bacterium]|nr:SRPBCC domain-containing protein [Acidobacteriota bacterium]MDH3785753.1 SRPBCC domain-containing protein [Acidobacteriota bacterium]